MLGTTIGKSNIVRSRDNTSSISSLSSVEVSLGVVISNSIGVGVWFINIGGLNISSRLVSRSWGMISWGSMDYWNMISWGSMDNWVVDSMSNWVVDSMCNWVVDSMGNWVSNKSVVSNWVVHRMGNWVSNKTMVSKSMMRSMAAMGDNSTMSMTDHMGRNIRGGGGGSKAKKSGNNKSLKLKTYLEFVIHQILSRKMRIQLW